MPSSFIDPQHDFALWAVLFGLAGFGFWCERYPWGRKYTGVMLMMTLAIILANLRIIPTAAPVYDIVWEYLVPLAIALLLFQANLRKIIRESGPVLIAFLVGSVAVVAGTLLGVTLLDLGAKEAELAGVFSGTYIGGSLNFAAVAEATQFHDGSMLAASVAADNVVTNLHFLLIIMLPGFAWLSRHFPTRHMDSADLPDSGVIEDIHNISGLELSGLLGGIALAFLLTALGKLLAGYAGYPQYSILVITLLALAVGSLLPRQVARLSGHTEAGNVLIFIFLASIGATADIWILIGMAPILFVFASIIVLTHLALLFGVGRIMRLDMAELIMASAVCIGGPSSAAAIASAKGWRELLIPGVLAGSLGYAIGSFIGVTLAAWLN
jgi:uncharacterized membrane protein